MEAATPNTEISTEASPPYQWKWITLPWLAFGLFDAVQTNFSMHAEGMHHNWITLYFTTLFSWLPWMLATPVILARGRRYPAASFRRVTAWPPHIAIAVAINLVYAAWLSGLQLVFNPYADATQLPYLTLVRFKFINNIVSACVLYAIVLVISYVLDSHERLLAQQAETARLNEQLSRAQLDALRRQIEPHFLFNALNSIAGLVREERNPDAINMIAGLSDLLRRSLDGVPHQQVALQEEVDFARKYLNIQKMRFADRLQIQMEVPGELCRAQVPSLILQPMVENAIKHGIAHRAQGGLIRIAARQSAGTLTLQISNDGPPLPAGWQSSRSGIGIANVRTRLQSLYGNTCALRLEDRPSGGVDVTLSLPFVLVPLEA